MNSIGNVISSYKYDSQLGKNNRAESIDSKSKPGKLGVPHYSLDGHLKYRNYMDSSETYRNNPKDIELIRSNSEKVRECISTLKKEYGY